jgi:hypothetical protein
MYRGTWHNHTFGGIVIGIVTVMISSIGVAGLSAAGANGAETVPTFTKDVAPILYEACVTCHRPGEVAPMSLISYRETRPWGRSIKNKVLSGEMPPWHADPTVGRFSNERRLTEAERDIIARWVDGGAPEGDADQLPPAPVFADGWQIGTPDVVIEMPTAFDVPAEGEVDYQYFSTPTQFTEDKWVQAIEVRPGARSVVHHILAFVQDPSGARPSSAYRQIPIGAAAEAAAARARERGREGAGPGGPRRTLIGTMAPGTNPQVFEPDTAMRIPKGSELVFQLHYTAVGEAASDRSRVGLIFADAPPAREMRSGAFLNAYFEIPAGATDERVDTLIEFTQDVEVTALFPHSHLLGTRWEYRLTYPDGRTETVLSVPKYDFNWQAYYQFEEPLTVPKGARIEASAWYDNSAANKSNPDPTIAVGWGEQTWDEMQYSGITYSVKKEQ